jgi:hypothetical protein
MAGCKLKVFQAQFGFYDTVVTAPSQAAALCAWGVSQGPVRERRRQDRDRRSGGDRRHRPSWDAFAAGRWVHRPFHAGADKPSQGSGCGQGGGRQAGRECQTRGARPAAGRSINARFRRNRAGEARRNQKA